jgi:patatin-related protein
MTTPLPQADYKQEVRFAVVMYGGVSLAIYINGIAQELLRLVRSTAPKPAGTAISGSERVYRMVSYLLAAEQDGTPQTTISPAIEKASTDPESLPPTRFVVDILSGTSAGGINGIFLGKALANGQDMQQLYDLWLQQGDIEVLINDQKSIEKPLLLQDPPTSLLNSERMYHQLLSAFDKMDAPQPARSESEESPLVDELDLFVTSTDLQGVVLPIRLSDSLVYERRHRNVMHFVYSSATVSLETTRNDFHHHYNPFLAFAARCTSSFPFAFEPMALCDIDALLERMPEYARNDTCRSNNPSWQRFYRDYLDPRGVSTVPFPKRAFGDGGYLDNKPFSFATETLMNRNADVPVDRKLIYIEPSPEHPEDDVEGIQKPDAIENVMSALITLPRYETIREDLQRVKDRNRLIERVNSITNGVDRDEYLVRDEQKATGGERTIQIGEAMRGPEQWAKEALTDKQIGELELTDMIKRKGRAYAAYHRLRISAVTDELAELVARVAGFDEASDYFLIVRNLVRAWRVLSYVENRSDPSLADKPTANTFLYEFDLAYPIRRVNYLRNKADALYRFDKNVTRIIQDEITKLRKSDEAAESGEVHLEENQKAIFQKETLDSKKKLNKLFVTLRKSARSLRSRHVADDEDNKFDLDKPVVLIKDKTNVGDETTTGKVSPVSDRVRQLISKIEDRVRDILDDDESPTVILDYFLGKAWVLPDHTVEDVSYRAKTSDEECTVRAEIFLKAERNADLLRLFERLAEAISARVMHVKNQVEEESFALFLAPNTDPLSDVPEINEAMWVARNCLGHYYQNYEDYDLLTYPILYDTNVGEADIIDLIRISPEDAKQLIDERETNCLKLAGSSLGHFGAFLSRLWRRNDILWGRLDGAERLISALLPNHPLRRQLIGEAQAEIMLETIGAMGDEEGQQLLSEALMRTKSRESEPELLEKFINNLFVNVKHNQELTDRLKKLIHPRTLRQFYINAFEEQSRLDRESTLRSSARATTVVGKILEALSAKRRVRTGYAVWIARIGQILWAMVEVAVPRSLSNLIFRHWLKLIYFLEALLIAGSTILLASEVQKFAITAFSLTAGIHLGVYLLSDYLQGKHLLLRIVLGVVGFIAILLAAVGFDEVLGLGMRSSLAERAHLSSVLGALPASSPTPNPTPVFIFIPDISPAKNSTPTPTPTPQPSPGVGPSPLPTANQLPSPTATVPDLDALIQQKIKQLQQGQLASEIPSEMRQGESKRVSARIAPRDIGELITKGLKGSGLPQVDTIPVDTTMKLVLYSTKLDAFDIKLAGEEIKNISNRPDRPYTDWEWDVIPKLSGKQELHLKAAVVMHLPGFPETQTFEVPVIDKPVQVSVDYGYVVKDFLSDRPTLMWVVGGLGSLLLVIGGWKGWPKIRSILFGRGTTPNTPSKKKKKK